MRCTVTLLALAAVATAADTSDWLEDLAQPPKPWVVRAGWQALGNTLGVKLNDSSDDFSGQQGNRIYGAVLVIAQTFPDRPGLTLGLGGSRTSWGVGKDVNLTSSFVDAYLGLTVPFNAYEGRMRMEILGYAGAGRGSLDGDIPGPANELGVDLGLTMPFGRSGFEATATAGWYYSTYDPVATTLKVNGTTYPIDLSITGSGYAAGLALAYRY